MSQWGTGLGWEREQDGGENERVKGRGLVKCPGAALTNDHEPGGSKQQKCALVQLRGEERN